MRWDRSVDSEHGGHPLDVVVLLLPPVSLGAVGAIVDPFVEANRLGAQRHYNVHVVSADGSPVALPGGGRLSVSGALPALVRCDALIIASDLHQPDANESDILSQLRRIGRIGAAFCGNRGGTGWLAAAGLLDNRRVAVHWEDMTLYRERHPALVLCASLYEIDADRLTASSNQATLDMMLCVIAQQVSPQLADNVARQLGLDRIRPGHEKQAVPATSRISQHPPKLNEALLVMEANLEEPLSSDEIAECVGISRRQLERLFKQNLDILPSRYYQELRLERARQLIVRTQQSIVQIGLSCGFSSGSHFATAYRAHFGITPREDRSRATLTGSQGIESRAGGTPATEPSC
ncbi:GlxA family transcriptional regulator [Aromatoleum toluclasticum]|uniref:GlxA family transcriptional regulator n=1 Tax=Aromatoleum toluclasticum TaxID=92003 RepID=UPI001D183F05|nr:GlxA family transcriptional regulator [Aromatoleum toluclasticum]MCC4115811.1 GlxA family transcriptional regulator [Aromatoleum toluclasticum]